MRPLLIALVAGAHFAGIFILLEVGRRIGVRWKSRPGAESMTGFGALEGAVFGLMGLLIAFTFSGAASRFDARRQFIVQEANSIGTAYLRLDLLTPAAQPELREGFRKYLDSRLAFYEKLRDDTGAARPNWPAPRSCREKSGLWPSRRPATPTSLVRRLWCFPRSTR